MPDSLSPRASAYLKSVAEWFAKAQIKAVNANMSRCIDNGRFEALKPFLREANLEKRGFTLWRVTGNILIEKEEGLDNLFFPLGISETGITVGDKTLMPYDFLRLTMEQPLSGKLDFLLVVIPEKEMET
ncbi:hypothetical protein BDW59DRAFT_60425 [Aspergillus cavernicola]|uniref:Uncharacterized protein n=1 Tax=Aspergillus cavernicola TaxID=176166 RepID=A0ABR4H744_9EURO